MSKTVAACEDLAAVYEEKRNNGLIDVKFFFQNRNETSLEQACSELMVLNQKIASGEVKQKDFGDLRWKPQ